MEIVAGLSVKNLEPRVWDPRSPYYISDLPGVMISYGDFEQMPARRRQAMRLGLRQYLNVPLGVDIYLDNGAFYFLKKGGQPNPVRYRRFLASAKPDWHPILFDAIPTPQMSPQKQRACFDKTMDLNRRYQHDGYVPVVHMGRYLLRYIEAIKACPRLAVKECIALGGLVPNLLRSPKAVPYADILEDLRVIRREFADKKLHVFGVGGTATLHITALLGFDSVDSSGWRNRAARGIVQLPGSGDRIVAELGNWRGRRPSQEEWARLRGCRCPGCRQSGIDGLKAGGLKSFSHRATHNLWVLLNEAKWLRKHLGAGTYSRNYTRRLDNSIYLPIIKQLVRLLAEVRL